MPLTQSDAAQLQARIDAGGRAGFYIQYYIYPAVSRRSTWDSIAAPGLIAKIHWVSSFVAM
jgi:hypothetical protein